MRSPCGYGGTGTNMGHQGGREMAWMESNTLLNAWTTVQSVVVSDRSHTANVSMKHCIKYCMTKLAVFRVTEASSMQTSRTSDISLF